MAVVSAELIDISWMLLCTALVMLMQAGFACLESGLVRQKNSINVAVKNFTDFCVSSVLFWLFGFALMFGMSARGLFGTTGFFFGSAAEPWLMAFFIFQLIFCGTATTIVSGAVAERMRFSGYLVVTAVLAGVIYPVMGHWMWGSASGVTTAGWLESRGFIDFAGSTVVHSVGGWIALAAVIVIGPRIGRFDSKTPIRGHNIPFATLGVFLLWFGWFGFNGGSTLGVTEAIPFIVVNTTLSGASGGVIVLILSWRILGRPDVTMVMNGSLAGLVGITASAHIMTALSAVIIGAIAALVMFSATLLLEKLKIDDVVGAFPVHGCAGVWGTLAVALFADPASLGTGLGRWDQLLVQATGVVVCFAWAFGGGFVLLWLINRVLPLRVSPQDERIGLNVSEHGAGDELLDLLSEMDRQRQTADFTQPVAVEPHTEVGQIATQYNRVLEKVIDEAGKREAAVEALRQKTSLLQLLQKVAAAANAAWTSEEALQTSLDEVCAYGGWSVGHVYMVGEGSADELVSADIWHLDEPERFEDFRRLTETPHVARGVGLAGQVLVTGKPVWIRDITEEEPDFPRASGHGASVRSGFAFPVFVDKEVAAVLEFFSVDAAEADDAVLEVMSSVGNQLGPVVERKRGEASRFRAVVDNMPESLWLMDNQGKYILVNHAFEELNEVTDEKIRGKTDSDIFPEDEADLYVEQNRTVMEQGRVLSQEYTLTRDGEEIEILAMIFPIFDLSGEISTIGGIEHDITERKRAEKMLQDSEARVRTMVSNIPGMIYRCAVDTNWTMEFISAAIEEITGYPQTDFIGNQVRSYRSVIHPDDRALVDDAVGEGVSDKNSWKVEYRTSHKDGSVRWVDERGLAVYDEEGAARWLDGSVFDITEQKRAEGELIELANNLQKARDEADRANQAKSAFLASMSHELRTPLNAIIGITELLEEDAQDVGQNELIEPLGRISSAGKNLLNLINEILDLSKVEAGKLDIHAENIKILDLINEVTATIQPLVEKNGNRMDVKCPDDVGTMHSDPMRVRQVLFNLLSNACKFTENGQITMEVAREPSEGGDWLNFIVADTGIGMTPEQTKAVFEEFSQADSSTTKKYGGTGLGLTISQRLCEKMGGTIGVESEPGVGTTFSARLPENFDDSA